MLSEVGEHLVMCKYLLLVLKKQNIVYAVQNLLEKSLGVDMNSW